LAGGAAQKKAVPYCTLCADGQRDGDGPPASNCYVAGLGIKRAVKAPCKE